MRHEQSELRGDPQTLFVEGVTRAPKIEEADDAANEDSALI
jgi:hypothetical protein